jgi:hypothetical protein
MTPAVGIRKTSEGKTMRELIARNIRVPCHIETANVGSFCFVHLL